jgi:hypothetical protein
MKAKFTTAVFLSAISVLFELIFAAPRAQAQGGLPVWTNRYSDPATGSADARAVAVDNNGNAFVTGNSITRSIGSDYVTIKYSNAGPSFATRSRCDGPVVQPIHEHRPGLRPHRIS